MSELANYLLDHHLDIISNTDDVKTAALEVIKAQDAALEEARVIIKDASISDGMSIHNAEMRIAAQIWLSSYPTPPAQAGGNDA